MKKCFQLFVLFVLFVFLVVVLFIGTVLVILQFAPRLLLRHTLRNNVYVVYNMNNIFSPREYCFILSAKKLFIYTLISYTLIIEEKEILGKAWGQPAGEREAADCCSLSLKCNSYIK